MPEPATAAAVKMVRTDLTMSGPLAARYLAYPLVHENLSSRPRYRTIKCAGAIRRRRSVLQSQVRVIAAASASRFHERMGPSTAATHNRLVRDQGVLLPFHCCRTVLNCRGGLVVPRETSSCIREK